MHTEQHFPYPFFSNHKSWVRTDLPPYKAVYVTRIQSYCTLHKLNTHGVNGTIVQCKRSRIKHTVCTNLVRVKTKTV